MQVWTWDQTLEIFFSLFFLGFFFDDFLFFFPKQTRTVEVRNISDLASEREIREFFSFSGEIDHIEMRWFVSLFLFMIFFLFEIHWCISWWFRLGLGFLFSGLGICLTIIVVCVLWAVILGLRDARRSLLSKIRKLSRSHCFSRYLTILVVFHFSYLFIYLVSKAIKLWLLVQKKLCYSIVWYGYVLVYPNLTWFYTEEQKCYPRRGNVGYCFSYLCFSRNNFCFL